MPRAVAASRNYQGCITTMNRQAFVYILASQRLEKKIKHRGRAWKIALIEKSNPQWHDLSSDFLDSVTGARNDGVKAQVE